MRRYLPALMLAACCTIPAVHAGAQAGVQVRILETDPPSGTALGRNDPFYVRIQFTSDQPVSLWARPYFHGQAVPGARTNASQRHSGSGEALGWFSFDAPRDVDEVRILAGGGSPYREWEVARAPVQAFWTGAAEPRHATAPWVAELERADRTAQRVAAQQASSAPSSVSDTALVTGFMLTVLAVILGSLILPVRALVKWRGGWRVAAALPAAAMAFVVGRIVIDTSIDPTSHNLWPFEIVMVGAGAVGFIALLTLARRVTGATRG